MEALIRMDTHHYWLPVSSRGSARLIRHAFRGKRWEGRASDTSVCGVQCAMAEPSELDWFQAPTCWDCTNILIEEQERADAALE
ncbi:hypothetical protein SAMN04487820_101442 [Actinopolyspora mzabensis]|uniref:Zinc-finger n=2 Tax=Actinopolyspora mzabensis TaxID=995066 RepID=A0A1G8W0D9_ACTMZ|nr:hypothetical protein SAMN04487820_101442 [Actinopolyspora mzabensis]